MADESMVRTLAAQAEAIWPQEKPLFERYRLPDDATCWTPAAAPAKSRIESRPCCRDRACSASTSSIATSRRLACARRSGRVRFDNRSIFELGIPDAQFDLVMCRHVLQAIPHADRAIGELARVTKRGGWIHLIAEDYLMINFEPRRLDPDDFWIEGRGDSAARPAPTCASAAPRMASCGGSAFRISLSITSLSIRSGAARHVRRDLESLA